MQEEDRSYHVVVGVCGGIAAYKSLELVELLIRHGYKVRVIMTVHAAELVSPKAFETVTGCAVVTGMFDRPKLWNVEHVGLAQWADLFVIAPATANIIGKTANGIADDLLSTTLMATKAPVLFVPSMNEAMYTNRIVQANIRRLKRYGYSFTPPEEGLLANGDVGIGRSPEPASIVNDAIRLLEQGASHRPKHGSK